LVDHGRTVAIGTMFKFATSLSRSLLSGSFGSFGRPGRPGSGKVHPLEDGPDDLVPVHGTKFKTFDKNYVYKMSILDVVFDHRFRSDMILKRIPVGISDPNYERIFNAHTLYLTLDVRLMIQMMTQKGYYDESLIYELMDDESVQYRDFTRDEVHLSAMIVFEHVARVMLRKRK
jgi:hypothetical protein